MSRSQNFKSYGRGKHSNHPGTVVNSSIQFDKFFFNNSNKPTAAKSAGTIGKWGMTSFTSLRSSSFTVGHSKETSRFSSLGKKRTQPAPDSGLQIKRPVLNNNIKRDSSPLLSTRKFFKSRNSGDDPNQKSYKSSNSSESKKSGKHSRSVDENKKQKNFVLEENKPKIAPIVRTFEKPVKISSKKVTTIKITAEDAPFPDDFHNLQNLPSPPKERDKPPIVLRIFKGTSQLISETGTKSDASETENSPRDGSRLEDHQTAPPDEVFDDENVKENVAVGTVPELTATVTTRSLRRRTPEEPTLPSSEPVAAVAPIPVKVAANRRGSENSKSQSPEPAVKTRSLRRRSPERSAKSPSPEPAVKTRILRRRSPEKSPSPAPEPLSIKIRNLRRRSPEKSPSPEPTVKTRNTRRHSPEKSTSPEPAAKTRSTRRRSPEKSKSKSPSPEPTITTRSLRRRPPPPPPPCETSSQPHTSPKRVLRSTKPAPPAGKIVITNLNSDHPSVYLSDDGAPPPPLPSPSRKDSKEVRGYSNRHKNKQPKAEVKLDAEPATLKSDSEAAKPDTESAEPDAEPILEKVEEILADLKTDNAAESAATTDNTPIEKTKVPGDTSLDEDRAELLQLLEDDEDEERNSDRNADESPSDVDDEPVRKPEPVIESVSCNPVVTSESQLKIKIKIPKPCRVEAKEAAAAPVYPSVCDSQDSGIDVKWDSEPNLGCSAVDATKNETTSSSEHASSFEASKELNDEMSEAAVCSDSEMRTEAASLSVHSSAPLAAVIKKGSIFKHRGSSDGNKKRLALYKHKWVDDKDAANNAEEDKSSEADSIKSKALDSMLDMELDDMPLTKFIRQPAAETFDFDDAGPVTGVKCSKKNKDFYTVVRNVKKAHQIQESGEFQEFNDDVEYILDALQDNNPIGTRCLSAITLATKCTEPAFRMHVRAHGTVTKFFRALHDATKDQSLGLCTATVMFVLSQDRLNMDLDRDSLELMLNLLESDASHTKALEDCGLTDSQLTKTRDRVRQICADIQAQGHAKHLNLDNITVGHLSMETLLSLTSKRAGEWFKEELRELGGLEHIIRTVVECCKHVDDTANAWSTTSLEKIRKVDRCLRVLENITMQNEQNNDYLLDYQNGILIDTLVRMYKVCDYEIPLYPTYSITDKESTGAVLRECLIANLKVLINITHDYQSKSHGSRVIGSRPGVIESSLHVLLQVPQYIPKEEKFDLMLLTLIMLINLVEHCESNRKAIIEAKAPSDEESIFETKAREPAVKALIAMFYNYEELARNEEKKTDAILEGENAEKPPTNAPQKVHEDFIEETISQLVQKAGQNMEHTLIAAYVVMLIGYLIIDNEDFEKFVRNHLPEKNFQFMISVLQKFYSFMTLTVSGGTVSNRGMKSIQMVIKQLIDSDRRHGFDAQMPLSSSAESSRPSDGAGSSKAADTDTSNSAQSRFCESHSTSGMPISAS